MYKIGIKSGMIWGKSRKLLETALGDCYCQNKADIYIETMGRNSQFMVDKVLMNQQLDSLNIKHPKTYYHPFDDMPDFKAECVVKHRFGSRGNHLTFTKFNKLDKQSLYINNEYVQYYVPFEREFRVGWYDGEILGIREKIGDSKIRNSKSCRYETCREMPFLREFANTVAIAFDIEFTGIDIGLWCNTFIVIELNSCPSVGEYWASKIVNHLINKLDNGG